MFESNVKDLIKFYKHLKTKSFRNKVKKKFESRENKTAMRAAVVGIIQARIYDVYPDPGTRTYALIDSFLVDSEDGIPNLAIYSDPEIAGSKHYPKLSYAAFFEEPVEFSTFITPRGISSPPRNHRPFFAALEEYNEQTVPELAKDAILKAAYDSMPDSLMGKIR